MLESRPVRLPAGAAIFTAASSGILGSLLTGSIPGIVVGSRVTIRVPDRVLRLVLAGVLFLVGGRLVT